MDRNQQLQPDRDQTPPSSALEEAFATLSASILGAFTRDNMGRYHVNPGHDDQTSSTSEVNPSHNDQAPSTSEESAPNNMDTGDDRTVGNVRASFFSTTIAFDMNLTPLTSQWMDAPTYSTLALLKQTWTFMAVDLIPDCPFGKAIESFREFTKALITGIAQHNPAILQALTSGLIPNIYASPQMFRQFDEFHGWVRDAMLKHPQRRTREQARFLAIVRGRPVVEQQLYRACEAYVSWEVEAYKVESLLSDPDDNYIFESENDLKFCNVDDEEKKRPGAEDACSICMTEFSHPSEWQGAASDPNHTIPMLTPCGHIICTTCLANWRTSSAATGVYTCPLCRGCLICGLAPCRFHVVEQEKAEPQDLNEILLDVLLDTDEQHPLQHPLRNIAASDFWLLRETTREMRVKANMLEEALEQSTNDEDQAVFDYYADEFADTWEEIRDAVADILN
jgi:hypothetical protein